jgi:hypothetical protein
MDNDDLIGGTCKHFTREFHVLNAVGDPSDSVGKAEFSAVILHRVCGRELKVEVTQRLIRHLRQRFRHNLLAHKRGRIAVLCRREQLPNFGQRRASFGIHRVVRSTCPQRVFIELHVLVHNSTENHRAKPAVSDR